MSNVSTRPTCGGKAKIKEASGVTSYQALQDEEVLKKVGQLKNTMQKFKEKAEALEIELAALKSK